MFESIKLIKFIFISKNEMSPDFDSSFEWHKVQTSEWGVSIVFVAVLFFKSLRESSDLNVDDMRGIYK